MGIEENRRIANEFFQRIDILMIVRDGRISTVHEYLDTQHVYDAWFKPEPAAV